MWSFQRFHIILTLGKKQPRIPVFDTGCEHSSPFVNCSSFTSSPLDSSEAMDRTEMSVPSGLLEAAQSSEPNSRSFTSFYTSFTSFCRSFTPFYQQFIPSKSQMLRPHVQFCISRNLEPRAHECLHLSLV